MRGLFLDSQFEFTLGTPNNSVGRGPTLAKSNERTAARAIDGAKRKGQDLLIYGMSLDSNETNKQAESPRKKRKKNKMFDTRYNAAMKSKDTWKIRSFIEVNELKRSYRLVNSTRSYLTVNVCNVASCSCSY